MDPGWACLLESATTMRDPWLTTASPSGDWPSATRARRACPGSLSSLAVENPSRALEPAVVSHRFWPPAEKAIRLGLHPAGTFLITLEAPGCCSAWRTSMTLSRPAPGVEAWLAT